MPPACRWRSGVDAGVARRYRAVQPRRLGRPRCDRGDRGTTRSSSGPSHFESQATGIAEWWRSRGERSRLGELRDGVRGRIADYGIRRESRSRALFRRASIRCDALTDSGSGRALRPMRSATGSRAPSRSSFYLAFFGLPKPKRDALCALYAFMRLVDDVSDEPGDLESKRRGLAQWRAKLDEAAGGNTDGHPILPALADTIARFEIPTRYFHDLISGAEMDLTVCVVCDIRPAFGILLSCGGHGRADVPVRFRLPRSAFAGSGRAARARVPVDEYLCATCAPISRWAASTCRDEDIQRFGCASEDLRGPLTAGLRDLLGDSKRNARGGSTKKARRS